MDNIAVINSESPLNFHVVEEPLFLANGEKYEAAKALIREDNGAQLAVVSKGYKVIQNADLFTKATDRLLEAIGPNKAKGLMVQDQVAHGGKTCVRELVFPEIRVESKKSSRSEIAFRTILINGFGGGAIRVIAGAIDFYCTNGMITGSGWETKYYKHTSGLQIANLHAPISLALDRFHRDQERVLKWMSTPVSDEQVQLFLEKAGFAPRLQEKLFQRYLIEARDRGATQWALYSALTWYSSHAEGEFALRRTGQDHKAVTLLRREQEVAKTVPILDELPLAA